MIGRLVPIEKAAGSRWTFLQRYIIPCWGGNDYLERLRIVQTPWGGVYLHHIVAEDSDVPHDHPWNFLSFVVKGGYHECLGRSANFPQHRTRKRWTLAYRRAEDAHFISSVKEGTYTVLLVGPRKREWGFYVQPDQWVHWKEHDRP